MKILVIQQKMIGDVLASSAICNTLKNEYPNAQIDYLIYPFTSPVVENNPNIDNLVFFKDEIKKNKIKLVKFCLEIRKSKYDIIIDAYGKLESNMIVAFSGAKTKIGFYKSYTNLIYTYTVRELSVPKTTAGLALENRMLLLQSFDLKKPLKVKPEIFLKDYEIKNGKQILFQNHIDFSKKIYMIGILGSGKTKTYPGNYMAELLDKIVADTNASLLFNYIPSQLKEAHEIFNLCQPETQKNIKIDIVPRSIREFLSITYHCDALLGNEGGAVNMAKALNKPTFTIFSTWIKKEAWNSFDDGIKNVSVHLKDFKPDLYGSKTAKEMKGQAMDLYQSFTPDLIIPRLEEYLKSN
ncbi:glycosyltransferase family 9 protein [Flavobacterium fluviatile]|uniref:glycosyltransferase family 9 protein n=1 Tax=Flavobacterium fluviatile TaxID=1862387 RepID=UPI0013D7A5D2|nr:glycosyltransferase family 9 protein [Flavobacterium fluviatile]